MNHAVILLLSYGIIRTELHHIKNQRFLRSFDSSGIIQRSVSLTYNLFLRSG